MQKMIQLDCQCQIKYLSFSPSVFRNPTLDTTQKPPIPCDSDTMVCTGLIFCTAMFPGMNARNLIKHIRE